MIPANKSTTWVLTVLPRNLGRSSRNTTIYASCPHYQKNKNPVVAGCRLLSTKAPPPSPEQKIMPTHAHTHFEEGNSSYAANFKDKGKLAIPPAKQLAIGTFQVEGSEMCALRLT